LTGSFGIFVPKFSSFAISSVSSPAVFRELVRSPRSLIMGGASLPPGFRFHPTDVELVGYYLKRKVDGLEIELEVIPVVDLYKFDPWELPGILQINLFEFLLQNNIR
jgi:hypothetical protein